MMREKGERYESGLSVMANTRLLFNTIDELEEYFGNHSIHSNGIKRSFASPQRLRAAYRDCNMEVSLLTDDFLDLDWLLSHYEQAWNFYRSYLSRRKEPEQMAKVILALHYSTYSGKRLSKTILNMSREIEDNHVDVAILSLLLLKAIPGYDSKLGDVTDIDAQFNRVLQFLEEFTAGCGVFDVLPAIRLAREEKHRTRLMLMYHTINILDIYENNSSGENMAKTSVALKKNSVELEIEGLWTDMSGKDFWKIENAINLGAYFVTHYVREAKHLLLSTRYTLHLLEQNDGKLMAYILHPVAIKHRIKGVPYSDEDHAWYLSDFPDSLCPDILSFIRSMHSDSWPYQISLKRVVDATLVERLSHEVATYPTIDAYDDCNYTLFPSLYAITQEAVYVVDDKEECFYKLPRYTEQHFESITIDDNVGILEMAGKRFLGIDERLLYIPLTPIQLRKYGIERVYEIE